MATAMFNKFFDIIYFINLDKRTDRLKGSIEEFKRVGISAKRFGAFDGDNHHRAFNRSQHGVLSKAVDEGHAILILEDDVEFRSWHHFESAVNELPEDWGVFYLGANINGQKLEKYSHHLRIVKDCFTTHAVGYSYKMAKWIVDNFQYWKDEYEFEGLIIYDEWLRVNVQAQFKCFLIAPMIAWQRPGFSDIWQNDSDYTRCFEDGNKLLV